MPRKNPNHSRPTEIVCCVCHGAVPVAPKGNVPNAHFACAEILRNLRRIEATMAEAAGAQGVNVAALLSVVRSEGTAVLNGFAKNYGKK